MTTLEDKLVCFSGENFDNTGGCTEIKVRYRLLMRVEERKIYSVEVTTESNGERDIAYADSISVDETEARNIFDLICQGRVTSCTLFDVLEDAL